MLPDHARKCQARVLLLLLTRTPIVALIAANIRSKNECKYADGNGSDELYHEVAVTEDCDAKVPQIPQIPCTEMAPTGSSIFALSKKMMEPTTSPPAIPPIKMESKIVTISALAVMPTRPAKMPLRPIERSGFLRRNHDMSIAPSAPAPAAIVVVVNTRDEPGQQRVLILR